MTAACRHHKWDYGEEPPVCVECGRTFDPVAADRGRRNSERGQSAQARWVARLGLTNYPKGPVDGLDEMFAVQVKSGGRFNETDWSELAKLKSLFPGLTALLLKVETPGRGRKARATVTLDVEDWIALHVAQDKREDT